MDVVLNTHGGRTVSIYDSKGRALAAPPPLGRTVSWPRRTTTIPGVPRWVQRRTMRAVMVIVDQVDGTAMRVFATVEEPER